MISVIAWVVSLAATMQGAHAILRGPSGYRSVAIGASMIVTAIAATCFTESKIVSGTILVSAALLTAFVAALSGYNRERSN